MTETQRVLDGSVALVTGGSRGIGRRIAEVLGGAGAQVFLVARDEGGLGDATTALQHRGIEAASHAGSAADPLEIDAAVVSCVEHFGRIDVLVNNAGIDTATSLLDPDWAEIERLWQLNYFGPWHFIQAAWNASMRERGGSVINIASTAAAKARAIMAAYGMSKAALLDLTRRMAVEAGPGVRVNAIAPGIVATDMVRELFATRGAPVGVGEDGTGPWPLRRAGTLDDVAQAALYLASPASGWITGQVLYVDGGANLP